MLELLEDVKGEFRDRIYSPVVTLSAFIAQVMGDDQSCRKAVARIVAERAEQGKPSCSAGTGAYCQARKRLPMALIDNLLRQTGGELHGQTPAHWQWKGHKVVLADGSTVSMADTPGNQEEFPQPASQEPGLGFPLARLVVLISLATGAVLDMSVGPNKGKQTGEHALLRQIMGALEAGDIFLADRYYCTYFLIFTLSGKGVDSVIQSHASRKVDFRLGKRLGRRDHVVEWHKPARPAWMDDDTYQTIPATMLVRETRVGGRVLVSTLLDPAQATKEELGDLYKRRWAVEVDLKFIKQIMKMDILRGRSPEMVKKEIGVHLLAYNLIRTVMAQAADWGQIAPNMISFKGTIQLLEAFAERIALAAEEERWRLVDELLRAIAYHRIGQRPGRVEPRAVKRRPKPFPRLTKPRDEARSALKLHCFSAI